MQKGDISLQYIHPSVPRREEENAEAENMAV